MKGGCIHLAIVDSAVREARHSKFAAANLPVA